MEDIRHNEFFTVENQVQTETDFNLKTPLISTDFPLLETVRQPTFSSC